MNAFRQLLGGLLGGVIVIGLIAGSVLLTTSDQRIAFVPSPTSSGTARLTPAPPLETPTIGPSATFTPTLIPTDTCPRPPGWVDHVVAPGEDLAGIAARYGIPAFQLETFNCLRQPSVTPGQVLFVPPLPTATPSPSATRAAGFTPLPTLCGPPPRWVIYIVQPGDTLSSLARATGTTVPAIMLANCLETTRIQIGQRLYLPHQPIPSPTRTPTPTLTLTPSPTGTSTPTPSPTPSPTQPTVAPPTFTPTASVTPSPSATASVTPTLVIESPTPSPTIDLPPTATVTPAPTETPVATPTPSNAP